MFRDNSDIMDSQANSSLTPHFGRVFYREDEYGFEIATLASDLTLE